MWSEDGDEPASERRNEVEETMDAIVGDVSTIEAALVVQIPFELIVDVVQDGFVAVGCVDAVTVTRRVDDGETHFDAALFDFDR